MILQSKTMIKTFLVTYKSFIKTKSIIVDADCIEDILNWLDKDNKYKIFGINIWKSEDDECLIINQIDRYSIQQGIVRKV